MTIDILATYHWSAEWDFVYTNDYIINQKNINISLSENWDAYLQELGSSKKLELITPEDNYLKQKGVPAEIKQAILKLGKGIRE